MKKIISVALCLTAVLSACSQQITPTLPESSTKGTTAQLHSQQSFGQESFVTAVANLGEYSAQGSHIYTPYSEYDISEKGLNEVSISLFVDNNTYPVYLTDSYGTVVAASHTSGGTVVSFSKLETAKFLVMESPMTSMAGSEARKMVWEQLNTEAWKTELEELSLKVDGDFLKSEDLTVDATYLSYKILDHLASKVSGLTSQTILAQPGLPLEIQENGQPSRTDSFTFKNRGPVTYAVTFSPPLEPLTLTAASSTGWSPTLDTLWGVF
ncbi:hypothetical protein ACFP81_10785 [Deinococcus lacus]|uniref:Lipoprotein n=1 Tax=Deinococcus lacus TaxID=392561 RepID=A0ABW1YDT4_9DEIO